MERSASPPNDDGSGESLSQLRRIFAAVTDGILVVDPVGVVLFANPSAERILNRGGLVGANLGLPLAPGTSHADIQLVQAGGVGWAELRTAPVEWEGRAAVLASIHDITERKVQEQKLALAAKVFETSQEGVVMTDPAGRIILVNRAFTKVTGYSAEEVRGKNPRMLKSGLHDGEFYRNIWQALAEHGYWQGEIWNRRKDGTVYPELLAISAAYGPSGRVSHYIGVFTDLSEHKEMQGRLDQLIHFDALTQLPSHAVFADRLEQAVGRARVEGGKVACLVLNIDRMGLVNEAMGFGVGDRLIYEAGQRLAGLVSEPHSLARLRGDEFAVVMVGADERSQVIGLANALRAAVARPFHIGDREIMVTARVGVSFFPQDGASHDALLLAADTALARARGEGGVCFFLAEMNARAQRWVAMESGLRGALARGELHLEYQPQVDAVSGQLVGVEALLRWESPTLGRVSPAEFIPIAEESGLIVPIGEWVLRDACHTVAGWQREGLGSPRVAVNVSAHQLTSGNFPDLVRRVLAETGLDRAQLEIEVTETAVLGEGSRALEQVCGLCEMGIRLSLDDFGTGYSSLSYLNRFDLSVIKIDQSFVRDITTEPKSAAIARATIAMAHTLGMDVVAEGVETEGQVRFLARLNCDLLQGYRFSRPVPAADLRAMLASRADFRGLLGESGQSKALLCVDDEAGILSALRRVFRLEGYRVYTAASGAEALDILARYPVQVILADQRMPGMSGSELLRRVKDLYPDTVRMVLSGYAGLESISEAINHGAIYKFLTKPWDDDALRQEVRHAFQLSETRARGPESIPAA